MKKEQKKETIESLTGQFEKYPSFYLTDASKLTVAQVNKLRRICHRDGVKMRVAKNTLIQKALEAHGKNYAELYGALKGETAIMFSDVANAPAKIIKEFRKDNEKPLLKAAYIESSIYLGEKSLNELAKLKSKHELLGEIDLVYLQSPASNLISALQSGKNTISGIVKTLSERTN